MQYTASSFAQPLTTQFRLFVSNRETLVAAERLFPGGRLLFERQRRPVPAAAVRAELSLVQPHRSSRLNVVQHGHIHVYVLYVAATLIALLIWGSL